MSESIRETVDSIVIAFVLAFLFRTFEAEAFVIPTGSMALTLMGDHKDLVCTQCGYSYRVSASSESANNNNEIAAFNNAPEAWQRHNEVVSSVCPNCRYRMNYDAEKTDRPPPPSYKGDRILVTKYSYEFQDPQRFDVAVFKNPSQAKVNYIKRVVGLPNEMVLIYRGDVYVQQSGEPKFRIARKPPDKAMSIAQCVYDHDYLHRRMHENGWPERWYSERSGERPEWNPSEDRKSFRLERATPDESWLRYRHYVPMASEWETLEKQALDPQQLARVKPQLITDFCEYNTERIRGGRQNSDYSFLGLHWVGDVGVECELEFLDGAQADAEAVLEIVEGGRSYQCRIKAASGDAVLSISGPGAERYRPVAKKAVSGRGPHRVRFANVDDRLILWVDGKPVPFEGNTNFQTVERLLVREGDQEQELFFDGESDIPALSNLIPQRQDAASPIGIAAKGTGLNVSHLRIFRDVYYIAESKNSETKWRPNESLVVHDYLYDVFAQFAEERAKRSLGPAAANTRWNEALLHDFMSDVDILPERFVQASYVAFEMGDDQFFVLGDNSPRSLDGRLWSPDETFVKRELLIGKALLVYWPHALDAIPGTEIPFPFFPNFPRMRMIR